jgi:hypothetical protein
MRLHWKPWALRQLEAAANWSPKQATAVVDAMEHMAQGGWSLGRPGRQRPAILAGTTPRRLLPGHGPGLRHHCSDRHSPTPSALVEAKAYRRVTVSLSLTRPHQARSGTPFATRHKPFPDPSGRDRLGWSGAREIIQGHSYSPKLADALSCHLVAKRM